MNKHWISNNDYILSSSDMIGKSEKKGPKNLDLLIREHSYSFFKNIFVRACTRKKFALTFSKF